MIELLNIGCTAAELVDKINEIVAAINDLDSVTDYAQLTNLPTLNGKEITGELTTSDLDIKLADASDYTEVVGTLATKSELSDVSSAAISEAQQVAKEAVSSKLDADPENASEVTMLNGESYIYIYGDGEMKKVNLENLTNNVALSITTKDSYDSAVTQQKRIITLKGDQNSNNVDYTCEGFVLSTSDLYLNGQRLVRDTDYIEVSSYAITMLTNIPTATDRLVFVAVPIS